MEWTEAIGAAVRFMEDYITEDITVKDVAEHVHISPFYFHKGFSMLCGCSITEYIRNRRLSLAGEELMTKDISVTELAMKYGYDSPDSFSRAFCRFHGVSPKAAQKEKIMLKNFAPLKLTISMKGGYLMDYRIVKKIALRLSGLKRSFPTKTQSQKFLLSGRSIMPQGGESMSAACLALILICRWEVRSSHT